VRRSGHGTINPAVIDQSPPSSGKPGQRTQQFLDERLTAWCRRLNLKEWRISVNMTHRSDLKPKTLGGIRWDKGKKSAVILGVGSVRLSTSVSRDAE